MRTTYRVLVLIPALALATACDRGSDRAMDDALKNDLALANQVAPNQFVSPLERGDTSMLALTTATSAGAIAAPRTTAPAVRRTAARTTTTARRTSTASSGTRVVYSEPAPQPTRVVKNTKRDAIIGAAAGAAIGAVTSKDKLKGAVIGAAAGGILGGIIGNNVDVQRKPY